MVEWRISEGLTPYEDALVWMEARVAAILNGEADECVWLLEHPPLYTAGTSAQAEDLVDPDRFPVYEARRGGEYTYHGPGQRVAYVMLVSRWETSIGWAEGDAQISSSFLVSLDASISALS